MPITRRYVGCRYLKQIPLVHFGRGRYHITEIFTEFLTLLIIPYSHIPIICYIFFINISLDPRHPRFLRLFTNYLHGFPKTVKRINTNHVALLPNVVKKKCENSTCCQLCAMSVFQTENVQLSCEIITI